MVIKQKTLRENTKPTIYSVSLGGKTRSLFVFIFKVDFVKHLLSHLFYKVFAFQHSKIKLEWFVCKKSENIWSAIHW